MAAVRKVGHVTTARRDKIAIVVAIIIALLIMIPLVYTVNRDLNKVTKFQDWQKEHRNNIR